MSTSFRLFSALLLAGALSTLAASGCGNPADDDDNRRRRSDAGDIGDGGNGDGGDDGGDVGDGGDGGDGGDAGDAGDAGDGGDGGDGGNGDDLDPTIGGNCTLGTEQDPQGSCAEGLACIDLFPNANVCTAFCTSDAECGLNGTAQNECVQIGTDQGSGQPVNACVRGCDPADTDSCNREGFKCFSFTIGNICQPDCRFPGNSCPNGLGCDSLGQCRAAGPGNHYDACGTQQTTCNLEAICLGFTQGGGRACMQDCTEAPTSCPAGNQCLQALEDGTKVCIQTCSNGEACPPTSTCQALQGGGSLCIPD